MEDEPVRALEIDRGHGVQGQRHQDEVARARRHHCVGKNLLIAADTEEIGAVADQERARSIDRGDDARRGGIGDAVADGAAETSGEQDPEVEGDVVER